MSLLHRADSTESSRKPSIPGKQSAPGRRLSYNPVGEWVPPVAKEDPIGAYEVSRPKRLAQVFAAVIYCLFAAGIVFGYAALKPVLIAEGVYRDQCTKEELEDEVDVCYYQEIRLNFMFTVAAVATNVCALPLGAILDRFGPRVCGFIGCVFLTAGCIFMSLAKEMRPADGYIPGYLFFALGGPFVFIPSFQLSNTFPNRSGLILALLTGAFDTSSAIFLMYRLTYEASNGTFKVPKFFALYLIVPACIFLAQLLLMPKTSYKTMSELVTQAQDTSHDFHDSDEEIESEQERERVQEQRRERRESVISEVTALLGPMDNEEQDKKEALKKTKSGVWGALHGKTAWQQIRTWWFVLIAAFTMIQMLRINYFVATIRPQYAFLLKSASKAKQINEFFDIALPLGGVISIPFIGLILDNLSTPAVLCILVSVATAIGVLGVLPYMWAAYANVVLFTLYRPLYYTTVSDYSAKVFGFNTFGKVYGLIICSAGLFNFLSTPLDQATHDTFNTNPIPVNILLLSAAGICGVALVAYVWIRSYNIERERLEDEAEGATETLVPHADQRAREDHHPIDVHGRGGNDYGTVTGSSHHA